MSDDAFSDKILKVVFYNDKLCIQRIRFSLMHELGHFLLGHETESRENESEADAFAANLLAPEALIKYKNFHSAPSISSYFGISIAAANHIMMRTKYRSFWSTDKYEAKLLAYLYPNSSRIHFGEDGIVTSVKFDNIYYLVNN
ncbi:ImmA/IrrE family metallo-endopeptidase [Blautia producta ATCC 27340 = DSM 2950]|nr:ImmA/IrrE family metallo-endopeptidase [Blautia producta ATCC 27340 = DSM 2950]